jgi:serine/threonine-protein kinase
MDDELYRARLMPRGPGWFAVIVISFVTSCCVVFGFQWTIAQGWMQPLRSSPQPAAAQSTEAKPENATVPPLVGLSVDVARELLTARGLRLVVQEKRDDERIPVDAIVAQEPLPQSTLPTRAEVRVTLSSGKTLQVPVPDVTGKPPEEARSMLEGAGLALGALNGPDAGERVVASSDPAPLAAVAKGTAVALTLEAVGVPVPTLVGLSWGKAKKTLEQAGFAVGKVRERFDEARDAFVVLEQSPAPGTRAPAGSKLDLVRNEE